MPDVINIGNQTQESIIPILREIGIKQCKIRQCVGLWDGVMEDAVEVIVYDMATPRLLDKLSWRLKTEKAFAVNENVWMNPRYET